jgi:PAS domain S-box-containing protein
MLKYILLSNLFFINLFADNIEQPDNTQTFVIMFAIFIAVLVVVVLSFKQKLKDAISKKSKKINNLQEKTNELVVREKELIQILDSINTGVLILQSDGTIVNANQRIVEMTKYDSIDELIGKHSFSFSTPKYQETLKKNILQNYTLPYEIDAIRKDGTIFPVLIQGRNIEINGQTLRIVSVIDFTLQKQQSIELLEAKEKAEQSTKSKSQFLANMSHEIRTPMNAIIGMTHLAIENEKDDKQKKYLQKIETNAKSLLNVLNDILDFSKIEAKQLSIEKREFELNKLIENLKDRLSFDLREKNLELSVNLDENLNSCYYGDNLRILQVLTNLLNNAIKFTNSGKIELNIKQLDKNQVSFEVKDTGIGIEKEKLSKLFNSFSQADESTTRKYGGTGLGLSISKELVELMNGTISVNSQLNIGSSFVFDIELIQTECKCSPLDKSCINTNNEEKTNFHKNKILVVEDNVINQEVIFEILTELNLVVDIANNGKEACEKFDNHELILMDIQMPIMDGYEATKKIRENSNIPIIALSANVMKEDIEKSKHIGMNEHLSKPIDFENLKETLHKYLDTSVSKENKSIANKEEKNKTEEVKEEQNNISCIDRTHGLKQLSNNEKLYNRVLNRFKDDYKDIKIDLEDEKSLRDIHTIKGIAATIGAQNLSQIAASLEKSKSKEDLELFIQELNFVILEI